MVKERPNTYLNEIKEKTIGRWQELKSRVNSFVTYWHVTYCGNRHWWAVNAIVLTFKQFTPAFMWGCYGNVDSAQSPRIALFAYLLQPYFSKFVGMAPRSRLMEMWIISSTFRDLLRYLGLGHYCTTCPHFTLLANEHSSSSLTNPCPRNRNLTHVEATPVLYLSF